MKHRVTPKGVLIFSLCFLLILTSYFQASRRSNTTVRLHDDQIDIQKLANSIAAYIITEGYGYKVEMVESTIKEVRQRLIRGDIDVTLEMWKQNNLAWYERALNEGLIQDLGALYEGGRQYWIVSGWYAEEKGIETVFDMAQHWQDFVDPEDPSKGIFFNCIFGWTCRDINKVKLKAYGLDRYYNSVAPLSPEALKSIYETANTRRLPVFGYYWEPNAVMTEQSWYILGEPDYSSEVWAQLIEAATNPGEKPEKACAYNSSGVYKVANSQLEMKAPDIVKMLQKMKIELKLFNELLFTTDEYIDGKRDFDTLARFFMKNYPEHWSSWVSEKAKSNIEKALLTASAESDVE